MGASTAKKAYNLPSNYRYSNLLYSHRHHLVLEAGTITRSQRATAGSWNFPMLQKPYRQLSYGRNGGTQSENRCQMSDHCYVRTLYVWKAIPAEASKRGTPNMKLELQRVCSNDRMAHPLPVMYTYGRKRVRLRCRQNMDYSTRRGVPRLTTYRACNELNILCVHVCVMCVHECVCACVRVCACVVCACMHKCVRASQ